MFSHTKAARARIVRNGSSTSLLAIFDSSTPPMIWQMDLEKMANYSLTLREKDGEWDLGIALPHGTFTPVAHFDERVDAEKAYDAVRKALWRRHSVGARFHSGIFFAVTLVVMFFLWNFLSSPSPKSNHPETVAEQQMPEKPKELKSGVPMSADDVLTIPQD